MAHVLIATSSSPAQPSPLLTVGVDLVARGHRVTVVTGTAGAPPPLRGGPAHHGGCVPGRTAGRRPEPMHVLLGSLRTALRDNVVDVAIADRACTGLIGLAVGDRTRRPPVLQWTPATERLADAGAHLDVRPARIVVPSVPAFECPGEAVPDTVRFVGAVYAPLTYASMTYAPVTCDPPRRPPHPLPDRPVVHVAQRTARDAGTLVAPALAALADEDVTVVVTTDGAAPAGGPRPANVRVANAISDVVPFPAVTVTDGGGDAVPRALSSGVPLVIGGGVHPDIGARVARSGAGIHLGDAPVTPERVRAAVRTVLADRRYVCRARHFEAAFARRDGLAEIAALVDEVVAGHRGVRTDGCRRPRPDPAARPLH